MKRNDNRYSSHTNPGKTFVPVQDPITDEEIKEEIGQFPEHIESKQTRNLNIILERSPFGAYAKFDNIGSYLIDVQIYEGTYALLNEILQRITEQTGLDFDGSQILFKLAQDATYVLVGIAPFTQSPKIVLSATQTDVYLRYRQASASYSEPIISQPMQTKEEEKKMGRGRGNERFIGLVIEKLDLWRRMYTYGVVDRNGIKANCNKKQAALYVGIKRKTLDDYMVQVKLGRMYGFDFNLRGADKMRVLRKFIRDKEN